MPLLGADVPGEMMMGKCWCRPAAVDLQQNYPAAVLDSFKLRHHSSLARRIAQYSLTSRENEMAFYKTRSDSLPVDASAAVCPSAFGRLLLAAIVGCGGSVASELPSFNSEQIAAAVIELYDRNGDGNLVPDELRDCPSLVSAMPRIARDSNRTYHQGRTSSPL